MVLKKLAVCSLALFIGLSMASCSSSGTSSAVDDTDDTVDTGEGTGDAVADTSGSIEAALTTSTTAAFQAYGTAAASLSGPPGLIKAATIDSEPVDCSPSGTATVSGEFTGDDPTYSFDITLGFDDCAGLNGDLNLAGDITVSEEELSFSMSFNGDIGGNGCEVSFDELTMEFSYINPDFSGSIDGSVSATCDGTTVTCTYDNVDFMDTAELEAACVES